MITTSKVALSFAGLAVIGSAAVLWVHFGTVILFDMASSALSYCF